MITVKIEESKAVDLLLERLENWTDDETTYKLYEQMYESYVFGGCFDNSEFNVMAIVDNDYVNYCDVISEGDDEYEDIFRTFNDLVNKGFEKADLNFVFLEDDSGNDTGDINSIPVINRHIEIINNIVCTKIYII